MMLIVEIKTSRYWLRRIRIRCSRKTVYSHRHKELYMEKIIHETELDLKLMRSLISRMLIFHSERWWWWWWCLWWYILLTKLPSLEWQSCPPQRWQGSSHPSCQPSSHQTPLPAGHWTINLTTITLQCIMDLGIMECVK